MDKAGWRLREEKEWYRYYESATHPYIYESKFATGEARITLADLQSRWQGWNEGEQVQFAQAFKWLRAIGSEDELILYFLMQQNVEPLSSAIATLVAKLPDKSRAARFLVRSLKAFPQSRGNFLAALADLAVPETATDLMLVFRDCSQKVAENKQDIGAINDLLYCSAALFRTTADSNYLDIISSYLHDLDDRVRSQAENAMRWAGLAG